MFVRSFIDKTQEKIKSEEETNIVNGRVKHIYMLCVDKYIFERNNHITIYLRHIKITALLLLCSCMSIETVNNFEKKKRNKDESIEASREKITKSPKKKMTATTLISSSNT